LPFRFLRKPETSVVRRFANSDCGIVGQTRENNRDLEKYQ
jgi:hypothetical protein